MRLTPMRAEGLNKFIEEWKEAAAAGMTQGEFASLVGLSVGALYGRQRNLMRRGIELPLLRGQRGVGSMSRRPHRIKVRPKQERSQNGEQFVSPAVDLRFVMYVGDCVA